MGAPFLLRGAVAASLGAFMAPAIAQDAWREKDVWITRAGSAHEWPFSVDEGELKCVIFAGQRIVLFTEPDLNDPDWFIKDIPYQMPRSVIVSTNPLEIFASLEDADLFLPFDSDFAVLIRRLAPFAAMGQALCEQILAGGEGAQDGDDAAGDED
jgi:hypothetical protein